MKAFVSPSGAAVLMAAIMLAGCVTSSAGSRVEGNWASDDGVFVAAFDNGGFTSRLVGTGETVVADGRYRTAGTGLALTWTSIATNERRTADCSFTTLDTLTCNPSVGQPFSMTRRG